MEGSLCGASFAQCASRTPGISRHAFTVPTWSEIAPRLSVFSAAEVSTRWEGVSAVMDRGQEGTAVPADSAFSNAMKYSPATFNTRSSDAYWLPNRARFLGDRASSESSDISSSHTLRGIHFFSRAQSSNSDDLKLSRSCMSHWPKTVFLYPASCPMHRRATGKIHIGPASPARVLAENRIAMQKPMNDFIRCLNV